MIFTYFGKVNTGLVQESEDLEIRGQLEIEVYKYQRLLEPNANKN